MGFTRAVCRAAIRSHMKTHDYGDYRSPKERMVDIQRARAHFKSRKAKKVNCFSCGWVSQSGQVTLQSHLKIYGNGHDGKCRICPKFDAKTWEENLQHVEMVHQGQIQYKCGFCSDWFKNWAMLRRHSRFECIVKIKEQEDNKRQKVTCEECGAQVNKRGLAKHKILNHGKDRIPCKHAGCAYISKNQEQAFVHEQKKHKTVTCEICGWTGGKSSFPRHKKTHEDPSTWSFQCEVCKKGFRSRLNFNDHMNTHTGAKPYKCSFCPAAFASVGTFGGHVRAVHEGKKRSNKKTKK